MEVPLLDLDAQYRPLRDDLLAAIVRVCDAQAFILGPEVEELEREMASFMRDSLYNNIVARLSLQKKKININFDDGSVTVLEEVTKNKSKAAGGTK